jgi:hypothetical protein
MADEGEIVDDFAQARYFCIARRDALRQGCRGAGAAAESGLARRQTMETWR